jgi:hypothetical protein
LAATLFAPHNKGFKLLSFQLKPGIVTTSLCQDLVIYAPPTHSQKNKRSPFHLLASSALRVTVC